ncbi:hypothetical protein [Actinomyces wuliandei]|uniref:hypothetical protein n=1 Tax=Actinomyces wuliandei TaxID=2057743 RepID=UPI00111B7CAB|nr:hypothetical protein [Actinomyces wuliandei]
MSLVNDVRQGLAVMVLGRGAVAVVLRAAVLYLLVFAVVSSLVSHLVGPPVSWVVSLAGLAGIHPFMTWVGRRARAQKEREGNSEEEEGSTTEV